MRVLLTGAFGNVGTSAVKELLAIPGVELVSTDLRNPRTERLAAELGCRVEWCDLSDQAAAAALVAKFKPELVIHIAAIIPPMAYLLPPPVVHKVNVLATGYLLDACNALERKPHFVFASSYSVHGISDATQPQVELRNANTPLDPQDIYGNHKRICEEMIRARYVSWTILRFGAIAPMDVSIGEGSGDMVFKLLFSMPYKQRRHGCDVRDVGYALASAARLAQGDPSCSSLRGKVLMIGGDKSWCMEAGKFGNEVMAAMGLLPLPASAYRSAKTRESWYYEDYMDTTESQQILQFQRHSFAQYIQDKKTLMGFKYYILKVFSIFAYLFMIWKAEFYWKGENYLSSVPFTEVIKGAAIPEKEKGEKGN